MLFGRLFACLFRRSPKVRREAIVLVTMHGAQGAWIEARERRRAAAEVDAEADRRHWNAVMREVERQTGYRHQADTATRMVGG